jgi:hypothetical protein
MILIKFIWKQVDYYLLTTKFSSMEERMKREGEERDKENEDRERERERGGREQTERDER